MIIDVYNIYLLSICYYNSKSNGNLHYPIAITIDTCLKIYGRKSQKNGHKLKITLKLALIF